MPEMTCTMLGDRIVKSILNVKSNNKEQLNRNKNNNKKKYFPTKDSIDNNVGRETIQKRNDKNSSYDNRNKRSTKI
jgi:hypothetical protein